MAKPSLALCKFYRNGLATTEHSLVCTCTYCPCCAAKHHEVVVLFSTTNTNTDKLQLSVLMQQLQWSLYAVALSTFHFMEFFSTALFKPDTVSYDCKYCLLARES
jgi:hypothetical protein